MVADRQRRRPVAQAGREAPVSVAGEGATHGSLWVIQVPTRSPSSRAMCCAYSAKRSAVSRLAQPPASCSGWGDPSGRGCEPARSRARAALRRGGGRSARPAGFERARAVGLHPRPRDREAVALEAERRHEVEVLAPAVVVVAGDVAGVAVRRSRPARRQKVSQIESPRPSSCGRALDLVGGGGGAETKSRWEGGHEEATYRRSLAAGGSGGRERFPCTGADGGYGHERGEPLLLTPARGRRAGRV